MRMVFYPAVIGWTLLGVWITTLKIRLQFCKRKKDDLMKRISHLFLLVFSLLFSTILFAQEKNRPWETLCAAAAASTSSLP
ncbi:MAG: hypothetical protein WDN26_09620 [Chitinophagaceae bacterium]